MYQAKDFIETREGLIFAVVANGLEEDKALCFLRYVHTEGRWRKVDTEQANDFLGLHYPQYRHFSTVLDAHLHAVPVADIECHYQPRKVLRGLLEGEASDAVLTDLQHLCGLLSGMGLDLDQVGVTGSLLVGLQNHASDIDLVCYDRSQFHRARNIVQGLIAEDRCQALNDDDWLSAYQRRACDFALDDYIWHEQRKYNKAMINQRKFDLSLTIAAPDQAEQCYRKLGQIKIEVEVEDDEYGFDYPARFSLKHPDIDSIVCFTATYCGQAKAGEWVTVAGQLEIDQDGRRRIVVGSNREAIGEFIKVIR